MSQRGRCFLGHFDPKSTVPFGTYPLKNQKTYDKIRKNERDDKKLKKLIAIICILLTIFLSLLIYRKQEQQSKNITAQEVEKIQEYITQIYMWKEITQQALPTFESINDAPEKWIWEVVKKNIDNYDTITYEQIQEKAKEIFSDNLTKEFPKEGNDSFIYNQETQSYEPTNIQLDSDNDTFIINKIEKTKEGYKIEIVEYIEDYSEEQIDIESEEEKEFTIHIKNTQGEEITSVKNTEGHTKIIEEVKANIDKFSKKNIQLGTANSGKLCPIWVR